MDRPVLQREGALSRYLGDIPAIIPISSGAADNATRGGFSRPSDTRYHSLIAVGNFGEDRRDRKSRRGCFNLVSRSAVHLKTVELAGVTASSPFAFEANINKSEHDRLAPDNFRWDDRPIRSQETTAGLKFVNLKGSRLLKSNVKCQ